MSSTTSSTDEPVLKPASAWLLEDPAYFTGWMRIQIQNTKESTSEASWYGPWTSVLTKGLLQTQIARDEWIELCPQKDIVILEYPEDPLEGREPSHYAATTLSVCTDVDFYLTQMIMPTLAHDLLLAS